MYNLFVNSDNYRFMYTKCVTNDDNIFGDTIVFVIYNKDEEIIEKYRFNNLTSDVFSMIIEKLSYLNSKRYVFSISLNSKSKNSLYKAISSFLELIHSLSLNNSLCGRLSRINNKLLEFISKKGPLLISAFGSLNDSCKSEISAADNRSECKSNNLSDLSEDDRMDINNMISMYLSLDEKNKGRFYVYTEEFWRKLQLNN